MGKSEHTLTENDSWCTPAEVLDPIYEHFGGIGLDPFGDPGSIVKADNYFTQHREMLEWSRRPDQRAYITYGDALEMAWGGKGLVFANGPFSICKVWVPKACKAGTEDGVESILLLPVRPGAKYWQQYVSRADAILFWEGRMKFLGAKHPAPFHTALIYHGPRVETFAAAFPKHWLVTKAA